MKPGVIFAILMTAVTVVVMLALTACDAPASNPLPPGSAGNPDSVGEAPAFGGGSTGAKFKGFWADTPNGEVYCVFALGGYNDDSPALSCDFQHPRQK